MEKMRFENPGGYSITEDITKSTWWDTVYEYTAKEKPLTFVHSDGTRLQPDRHFFTNQGSIPRFPPFIRMFIPKDRFLGFYLHDSGYMDKGLWVLKPSERPMKWTMTATVDETGMIGHEPHGEYVFTEMTRKQVDDLLYDMILADPIPGSTATAWLVWSHVRMYGGWSGWGKGDVGKPKPANRSRVNPHGTDHVLKKA